ncbi:NUDIX hydrolase [Clostridium gasigenes]|uniref:NUDIX hydrolase n=1 Tax=Clostridium gasigenes TaxID=94869 RepID=UPI001C0C5469|nr:CoA pyrophosphatase [Clostridium gasigenes]MBU3106243.1 CoA pyrophosphatase [Clostridium gasigenes]
MKENLYKAFKNFTPYINGAENMKKYSILIPLVEKDNKTHILFEVRAKTLRAQPGEICFPGGGIENNESTYDAAIRETCEELGINKNDIEIISPLDLFVSPFNFIINPYVGWLKNIEDLHINKDEVDHIFLVPVDFLLKYAPLEYINTIGINRCADFPFDLIQDPNYKFKTSPYPTQFYIYNDYVIWGLTAKILNNFLTTFKDNVFF